MWIWIWFWLNWIELKWGNTYILVSVCNMIPSRSNQLQHENGFCFQNKFDWVIHFIRFAFNIMLTWVWTGVSVLFILFFFLYQLNQIINTYWTEDVTDQWNLYILIISTLTSKSRERETEKAIIPVHWISQ